MKNLLYPAILRLDGGQLSPTGHIYQFLLHTRAP